MLKVVFLDSETFSPGTVVRRPAFPHEFTAFGRTAPEMVAERVADADIVITNKVRLTAADIAAAPRLRLVALAATGYDNVDLDACRTRGIVVSNIRGYALKTVPEHVFALMLSLRRSLSAYQAAVRAGRWQEAGQFCFFDYPIRDLAGSMLGIIGGGALGSEVARLGRAFGMEVLFAGRKDAPPAEGRVAFAELLGRSDVITLHCPLTPATRGLIAEAEFSAMTRRPILINTARGGLVDEAALVDALDQGLISAAGFDVATTEPPAADNPLMSLAGRHNVLITPHVAWASAEAIQGLADQLIDNLEAFVAGAPTNRVV